MLRHRYLACVTAGLALAAAVLSPAARSATDATYYVSLGDSGAQGYQPIGGPTQPGAPPGYTQGYSDQLFKLLRDRYDQLDLVKLGCFGESTATMIDGHGRCAFTAGSQLREAEAFLAAHPGHIALITVEIGADDVLGTGVDCFDEAQGLADLQCVQAAMPQVQANIRTIVQRLRAAAPGVPIAGANYADVLLGMWTLVPGPVGMFLAHTNAVAVDAFNAAIDDAYAAEDVPVADVARSFQSGDFGDFTATKDWGLLPLNVANVCLWTWFCSKQYPGDVHANSDGYGVIARAFANVLK